MNINVWFQIGVTWNLQPVAAEGFRQVVKNAEEDVYVTSGREGDHHPASLHYLGLAWDQRAGSYEDKEDMLDVLPGGDKNWDVIYYPKWNGFHIEYDPK